MKKFTDARPIESKEWHSDCNLSKSKPRALWEVPDMEADDPAGYAVFQKMHRVGHELTVESLHKIMFGVGKD